MTGYIVKRGPLNYALCIEGLKHPYAIHWHGRNRAYIEFGGLHVAMYFNPHALDSGAYERIPMRYLPGGWEQVHKYDPANGFAVVDEEADQCPTT